MAAARTQYGTVNTTDDSTTTIFNDGAQPGRSYHAVVHARETGVSRSDHGTWLLIASVFQNSEAAYSLVSTQVDKATSESAGLSWVVTFSLDGSNNVLLTVTGEAATTITWEATVTKIGGV